VQDLHGYEWSKVANPSSDENFNIEYDDSYLYSFYIYNVNYIIHCLLCTYDINNGNFLPIV